MKKAIIWFLAGALLMMGGQAAADSISFTGKKVAKETKLRVNGKEVGAVLIIDNRSFAEVRGVANALGMGVSFGSTGVDLNTMDDPDKLRWLYAQHELLSKQIAELERQINHINNVLIPEQQTKIDSPNRESTKNIARSIIEDHKNAALKKEEQKANLQAQLADVQSQITELEAKQSAATE
jgi:hypothetical protein